MGKFTAADVRARRKLIGKHYDGDGLLMHVISPSRAGWFLRYQIGPRERMIALGNADRLSLAEAREKADAQRKLLDQGIDPLAQRREAAKAAEIAEARATTFTAAIDAYFAAHKAGWKNPRQHRDWRNSFASYVEPEIGGLPCTEITARHVLKVLQPIWTRIPDTAVHLRGRIEAVLSYATVAGWREGPNPAIWRGNLQLMLPAKGKVRRVKHFAALDWAEGYAFMRDLRARDRFGAKALEFAILTACRSGEVRAARWDEIDMQRAIWTIPGQRMKSGREHRVPLSAPALAILRAMAELQDGSGLVFIGYKFRVPMSDMTLGAVLKRMGRPDLTVHGFRSTFRDWAAETTSYPNHVVEMALAHTIGSAVEAAYRRGDLLEKRAALMRDWAAFLARPPAEIRRLPGAVSGARDTAEAGA